MAAAAAAAAAAGDHQRPGAPLTQLHPAFLPQYPFYTGPGILTPGLRPAFLHQPPERSKSFTIDAILGKGDKDVTGRGDGRVARSDGDGARVEDGGRGGVEPAGHPYLRSITCPTALRYGGGMPGAGMDLSKGGSMLDKYISIIVPMDRAVTL